MSASIRPRRAATSSWSASRASRCRCTLDDAAPLPEPEVRRLGAELADGVAAAHARGIVHRDLKPANVMLDGERPKIVDFGIAKHLGARTAVTTGRMIGTLAYMAPEQLASGMIAPCTDIWALGVILFEATTGRHPFENFDDGRCPQLFDEPARARSIVPAISESLDEILARCLSRDPARRPASAEELASLLRGETAPSDERITADAGPVPAPVLAATLPPRPTRLRAPTFAIGAAAAIALVVVAATRSSSDAPQAAPIAEPAPVIVDAAVAIADEPSLDAAPIEIELAKVEVRSKPTGAEVLVGGKSRGVTPLTIENRAARHRRRPAGRLPSHAHACRTPEHHRRDAPARAQAHPAHARPERQEGPERDPRLMEDPRITEAIGSGEIRASVRECRLVSIADGKVHTFASTAHRDRRRPARGHRAHRSIAVALSLRDRGSSAGGDACTTSGAATVRTSTACR